MTINFSKDLAYKLANTLLLVAIFGLLLWSQPWSNSTGETRKITVMGEATIEVEPDEYLFTPRFEERGTDKDALKGTVTKQANEVIDKLKELGVEESDMKLDVSSYDRWYWREGQEGVLSASLQIKTTNKDIVQSVQDYLLSLDIEGNLTPNATFSEAKRKEIDTQVTELAINDAKAKAEQQARLFDAEVGDVIEVKKDSNGAIPFYSGATTDAALAEEDAARSSLPVLPGENKYSQTITVVYELK